MIDEFPITLITRNSKVNRITTILFVIAFICLIIFYISMFPSERSSTELQALWFIEGVPLWIKKAALYGLIILSFVLIVDILNRHFLKGILFLNDQRVAINTKKKTIYLNYDIIKEVAVVGRATTLTGDESKKLKIIFKTKNEKLIRLKLLDYSMADELIESLNVLEIKDIKMFMSDFDPYWPES